MTNEDRHIEIKDKILQLKELQESFDTYISLLMAASDRFGINDIDLVQKEILKFEKEEKELLITMIEELIGAKMLHKEVVSLWALKEVYKLSKVGEY